MKLVPIHHVEIKSGGHSYRHLWKGLLMGPCTIENVREALDKTEPKGTFSKTNKIDAIWILDRCGLPEKDARFTHTTMAGTVVGLVKVEEERIGVWDV